MTETRRQEILNLASKLIRAAYAGDHDAAAQLAEAVHHETIIALDKEDEMERARR